MSEVQVQKIEVEVTKEAFEVFQALEGILTDIREKKSITEIAAGNLQSLMIAVAGIEKIGDEAKHEAFYKTAGVGLGKLAKALLAKPVVVEVTPEV